MAILSVTELRTHISSGLGDDALQRLLDASEADILEWDGAIAETTERHASEGTDRILMRRPVALVTSVEELAADGSTHLTLSANDYRVTDRFLMERLQTGDNPRSYWYGTVEVVYTPTDDTEARERDQVDLVKLALAWEGVASHREGEFASTTGDYDMQRLAILQRRQGPPLPTVGGRRR